VRARGLPHQRRRLLVTLDLLRRRTVLMEQWSAFLTGEAAASGEVVPLKRGGGERGRIHN
jgi:hypothetical protein